MYLNCAHCVYTPPTTTARVIDFFSFPFLSGLNFKQTRGFESKWLQIKKKGLIKKSVGTSNLLSNRFRKGWFQIELRTL